MEQAKPRWKLGVAKWSWLLAAPLLLIYLFRLDATAAITYWPSWFFAFPVLLLCFLARIAGRGTFKIALPWLILAIVFFDAPLSLFKFPYSVQAKGDSVRVISLNCAMGNLKAIDEAMALDPDLLLLQESPSQEELQAIAKRTGMKLVFGNDCSILAKGELTPVDNKELDHTWAAWSFRGINTIVCSLRLSPPLMRFDLWNPATWRAYSQDRRMRRERCKSIWLEANDSAPYIIGGDFNYGPDAGIEGNKLLSITDAFLTRGFGWGGTGTNDYPMVRVDRIHCYLLDMQAAWSVKTKNSDHRMVVVDLRARGL